MSPTPMPQAQELADEVVCVLFDHGPLDLAALSAALGEDPDDEAWTEELYDAVDECDRLDELSDGRLADGVALLRRCTLTRRLTDAEAADGHLELHGDLYPLVEVLGTSVPLARGGRARVMIGREPGRAPTERLVGPPGWLGDARPGDLVGLRLADALLHVSVRPTLTEAGPAARALAAAAAPYLEDSDFDPPRAGIRSIVWDAAAAEPDAFVGVLPPLSDVAGDVGLRLTETMLLAADADLGDLAPLGDLLADIAARVRDHADDDVVDDVGLLRDVTRALERDGVVSGEDLAAAAEALTDPDVFDVYLGQPTMREGAALLGSAVAEVASGRPLAAGRYLQASASLAAGDMVTAERHVTEALRADPDFPQALIEAARIAEIRGDAPAALRLLGRAGLDDSGRAERLRGYTTGETKVGRNDPCPCGSGRKSKRCCGDRPGGALPQRAGWLLEKVYDTVGGELVERRLTERLETSGRLSDWVEAHARHPIVEDVVLFDLGLLDDFLDRWGPLLPDDERELAGAWRATRRGLYDVRAARGEEVILRDRLDGTTLTARHPGPALPRDVTLLSRLLPDGGGGWLLTAGVRVRDTDDPAIARTLDPGTDPLAVAEVWAAGRPVLSTTEGEPTVACLWEAPLSAGAAEPLGKALRDRGLAEDEPGVFVETADVDGQPRVRGTVTVTDELVRIDTNAERRLARLTGYVREALGDLEAVVDRRTPMWRAMDDQRRFGVLRPPPEPTPEEQAALEQVMREQERRWVDEPVPALGGLTPRAARDHPTGRPALEALLAAFDDQPGGFDPDRLRTLLDLPVRGRRATRAAAPVADRAQARKEARARRAFAFPRLKGEHEGIDVGELDPADEDDRWLLVEAEHALEGRWAPDDPYHAAGGEPRAHYAMHAAVASQLFEGDPPQLWPTAQRLLGHGYDRHEVLHMLAAAFAGQLWLDQKEERDFNLGAYVERLEALPDTWEQTRAEGGVGRPRGGRRPPAGHGR